MRWWQIPILALIAALGGITTALAIDTSSALYTSNIQLFNLGITRQNFPAATEISGSALIDGAFMEADTLNAVIHEGPIEIPSMPPNNRIRILDFVLDDGGSFTDWQSEAQDATELDFPLLPASPAVDDAAYFACDNPCRIITINIGQEAIADDLSILWEYFDGTSFVTASNVVDRTESFTLAGMRTVSFDMPSDFATTSVTGSAVGDAFWVRGRVTDVSSPTQQALGTQAWYENGQWWMWGKSQNINQELLYSLSTGGPDLVTNHQIIPGDAGIVTPDDASIELGDTYTVHFDGSINFTAGITGSDVCLVCKDGAFRLYISDFDAITLDVTGAGTTSLTLDGIPDSVNLPTSTTPHIVDVISDGTNVTLAVDGVGSTSGTAQSITDNANDWTFGSNGGFVFANTIYFLPDDTAVAFELFDTETEWDTGTLTDMVSTGGQPSLTEQFLTEASADDGMWIEGTSEFFNSITQGYFGFDGGGARTSANTFYRFDNVRIDQGATITAADLVFTPFASNSNATVSVDIVAVNEDDAAAPSTFAAAEALARTTAVISWSPVPAWVSSPLALQTSPDIAAVIQEVIDRPGWISGNAIVVLVEDSGTTAVANTIRSSATFESSFEAVRLEITVDTGQTFTDDFIEMEATATDSSDAGFLEDWGHSCSGTGCVSRVRPFDQGANSRARFGANSFNVRAGNSVGTSGTVQQDIDASAGQIWSFSVNYVRTIANNDTATFEITFRDAPGGTILQTNTANLAVSTTLYQVATINNITAPAGTASIRVRALVTCNTSCSSASGVWIDGVMAAIAAAAPNWPDAANALSNSSFEQIFQTSATWVSPTIALNQTSVASSSISWDSFSPFTSTLLVETNLNGAGFVTATNNAAIPGISVGGDVSGQTLQVRITTTPSDPDLQVFSPWASLLAVIINDDVLEDSAILFYQLRTTPGVEIEDLSPNFNNGVMSYPVQLTGIFSVITPLRSNRAPLSQQSAIGAGDFAAAVTGSDTLNLFGDDTGEDFIPFVAPAIEGAQDAGFPTAWLWVIGIMILGIAVGAFVWRFTDGNELLVSIVLAGTLVFAAALGDGLIPGWVPFIAIIMMAAYNILRSRLPI